MVVYILKLHFNFFFFFRQSRKTTGEGVWDGSNLSTKPDAPWDLTLLPAAALDVPSAGPQSDSLQWTFSASHLHPCNLNARGPSAWGRGG